MTTRSLFLVIGTWLVFAWASGQQGLSQDNACASSECAASQPAAAPDPVPAEELSEEAEKVVESLRATLPEGSEARVMLEDIVAGRRLGPDDGWFRVAVSQSRYDWSAVSARYDRDADGKIQRPEFPGCADDFQRLDRNHDAVVTADDLDWKDHALVRSPGAMLFRAADQDTNGKLTRDEFLQLFDQLDAASRGYLSLDDLRNSFQEPAESQQTSRTDRPSRSTLVLGFARQELGSLQPGSEVGEKAPDFTLTALDGTPVTLSSEIGAQPIVLIFGNFTCWPFRSNSGNLDELYQRYRDRAKFFLIYVREAHPSDGWWSLNNQQNGIDFAQPTSDEQRCSVAGECRQFLQLGVPMLVDTVQDTVGTTYSGMPNRLYLIDRQGRVAFKSGRGPFGFKPGELEQALIWNLAQEQADASSDRSAGSTE